MSGATPQRNGALAASVGSRIVGLSDYLLSDYLAVELSIDGGWTLLILESLVDLASCETSCTAICASHHHGRQC